MRKIIVGAMVSLDGVMQAPGGTAEDPSGDFKFGGWIVPFRALESREELEGLFRDNDLLLGRKTYVNFAEFWPSQADHSPAGSIGRSFSDATKYAVSRSGNVETNWQRSVLLRDIADVKRLKADDGPNLVTQGSTELVHALLAHDLVDAITTFTFPVVLGGGKKLFADGSAPQAFKLTGSRISSKGVIIALYARDGEVKIGNFT